MVVFGLVLVALAAVVIAYMWLALADATPMSIDYGFLNVELTPLWIFFAGGITLAALTCGLWLMGVGAKSQARRSKEMRQLKKQARTDQQQREAAGKTSPSTTARDGEARHDSARDEVHTDTHPDRRPILPRPERDGDTRPDTRH